MIGEIEFTKAGRKYKASLTDHYRWTCNDAEIESLLNEAYPAEGEELDEIDQKRRFLLYRAGSRLGGEVKTFQ